MRYAPYKYPDLVEDITNALDSMLGPGEYKPVVEKRYCLRSSTLSYQTLASQLPRQTPRYLQIIATPDDEQNDRLKAEQKGNVGALRWDCMEEYVGSTINVVGAHRKVSYKSPTLYNKFSKTETTHTHKLLASFPLKCSLTEDTWKPGEAESPEIGKLDRLDM